MQRDRHTARKHASSGQAYPTHCKQKQHISCRASKAHLDEPELPVFIRVRTRDGASAYRHHSHRHLDIPDDAVLASGIDCAVLRWEDGGEHDCDIECRLVTENNQWRYHCHLYQFSPPSSSPPHDHLHRHLHRCIISTLYF